ncbi:MAG TPA: GGDEF domain-containing protein [Rhodocyclaceae bacterium]|nr:GGDEF domain-containing protein [Rhodocyclaceae bacterium]
MDVIWNRLTGLMPGELNRNEMSWLVTPHSHLGLLSHRRATMIINRVRLFAFLFAFLTPLWSVADYLVFPFSLWLTLAVMRAVTSIAFIYLLYYYKPPSDLFGAYRAMSILFAIPTVFFVGSHIALASYNLDGISAAIGAGYAFLPFVLLAGLAIFPLAMVEVIAFASPILIAQIIAGIMSWSSMSWPSFFGAFWLLLLITGVSVLAGMSQLAFMIALVRQAFRDQLTGSFSRRSGEEILDLQTIIARRSQAPLAVAFIDLDHFKSINDKFGHDAGDQALKSGTERINQHMRRGDVLVRWGGEEFLLIMPNTDIKQAEMAISRMRQVGLGERPDGTPLTASIGIAERMADGTDEWHDLVEKADHRMYRAKQEGRNRYFYNDEANAAYEQ